MAFFTRYKPPKSPSVSFEPGSTLTRVEFLQESDINRLVERFRDTGSFYDPLTTAKSSQNKPFFGDFTNIPDYQTAMNTVIQAEELFASLPSKVRDRFHNDPGELLAFVGDEKNRNEAISLGLIEKPLEPQEQPQEPLEQSLSAE